MKSKALENEVNKFIDKAISVAEKGGWGRLVNTFIAKKEFKKFKEIGVTALENTNFESNDVRTLSAFFLLVEFFYNFDWGAYYHDSVKDLDDSRLWISLCCGFEILGKLDQVRLEINNDEIKKMVKQLRSDQAKKAVSMREDMALKPSWIAHVKKCIDRGHEVKNVTDLLNIEGYDLGLAHTPHITLKKWAKEAVTSIKFKAGRPK